MVWTLPALGPNVGGACSKTRHKCGHCRGGCRCTRCRWFEVQRARIPHIKLFSKSDKSGGQEYEGGRDLGSLKAYVTQVSKPLTAGTNASQVVKLTSNVLAGTDTFTTGDDHYKPYYTRKEWASDEVARPYTTPKKLYDAMRPSFNASEKSMGCHVLDANLDTSLSNLYRFRHPALSETKVCEHIIEEAEKYAMANGGWTTARRSAYPTTDVPVSMIKPLEHVFDRVRKAVLPYIEKVHNIPGDKKWHFNDLFVVKYKWAPSSSSI